MPSLSRRQFLAAVPALATVSCAATTAAPVESVEIPASDSVNPFAASLYGELRAKPGNTFLSPSSIHTALAMTAAGAKATTLTQMDKVLHLPAKPGTSFASKSITLAIANALWAQTGYPWSEAYKSRVTKEFHAGIRDTDYSKPEAARKTINDWVEAQTKDRIKDLLPAGSITNLTRLVLTNAIYFKGDWATAFDKQLTRDFPFSGLDGKKKSVPLMYRKADVDFLADDTAIAVKLPYKGNEISFVGLLPANAEKFDEFEKSLSVENWSKWTAALKPATDVQVYLPRFKIETEFNLNDPLKALGMTDAFSDTKADFSGMTSSPEKLSISLVIHKAFVEVNEEGTEAAAATGVVVVTRAAPAPAKPKIFRADRPFLFALMHNATGTILFLGRYTTPS